MNIHMGRAIAPRFYVLNNLGYGEVVTQTQTPRDIGIVMDESLTSSSQVDMAIKKVTQMLHVIRISFKRLSPKTFIPLFAVFVRHHLANWV